MKTKQSKPGTAGKSTSIKILALDLSSSTGYAILESKLDGNVPYLGPYGSFKVAIKDFNVNKFPDRSPEYPFNIIDTSDEVAKRVLLLVQENNPDIIIIENTVKGRNRHTQRLLEWIHLSVLNSLHEYSAKIKYIDPSEWRKIVGLYLSKDDKKHNTDVSKGKIRGKITRKHLSVRLVNDIMKLELKLKDDDIADAICLAYAICKRMENER